MFDRLGTAATAARAALRRARSDGYWDYWTRHVSDRYASDPRAAVGDPEQFDELGRWQFDLLRDQGLDPSDDVLDVGCGVLRGGRHIIPHLDDGTYTGMDINGDVLDHAREVVNERGWSGVTLVQNQDLRFRDAELDGRAFDVVLAQSVLTHCPPGDVHEFANNLHRVLADGGQAIVTVNVLDESGVRYETNLTGVTYHYTPAMVRALFRNGGLGYRLLPDAGHPNGQSAYLLRAGGPDGRPGLTEVDVDG